MVYTKEDFKRLWEADEMGGGITFDDAADCAKAWGLHDRPKCCPIERVLYDVCKAAGVKESDMPDNPDGDERGNKGWRQFPNEKPTRSGEYLVRGIGGLNNKRHHWVCLWIDDCDDRNIAHRFFYGGNEFNQCPSGEFEWMDLNEL